MAGEMQSDIQNERRIKMRLKNATRIDKCTFNVSSSYSKAYKKSFPVTVRYYNDIELARDIHQVTSTIYHPSVTKSQRIVSRDTGQAKIIFDRFYKYSFNEWMETGPKPEQARKVFRSIVYGIDLLYGRQHHDLTLEECIRVDEHDNAQIVLNSKKSDNVDDGIYKDIIAFKELVNRVFSSSKGYPEFVSLHSHLSSSGPNDSLRILSYYIFHNALFYEIGDRSDFMHKLLMFSHMGEYDFENTFYCNPEPMPLNCGWWKKTNTGLNDDYGDIIEGSASFYPSQYQSGKEFLLLYFRCLNHGHKYVPDTGVLAVQEAFDRAFPDAIYLYFNCFVKRIAQNILYKGFQVLEYMRNVVPASDFLRSAA